MKTYLKSIFATILFASLSWSVLGQDCGIWYVSSAGGTSGTPASPASLQYALSNLNATNNMIRLLEGTYSLNQSLAITFDGTVIDGGYQDVAGQWIKSSAANSVINIDPALETPVENGVTVGVYRGIIADNAVDFGFYDVTINVLLAGATGNTGSRGRSIYGVHLNNCNNYHFVRCEINTGDAGDGVNGTPAQQPAANNGGNASGRTGGAGGTPGGGAGGLGGQGRNGCSQFSAQHVGGDGGLGDGITAGGAGGAGVQSSANCCSSNNGKNGVPGSDGVDGSGWNAGDRPTVPNPSGLYFVPGGQADPGGNGKAGGGGGGGSGGKGGTDSWCSSENGGNGGGGGGGGAGGNGGAAGYGGGATVAIYAYGSGSGNVIDCLIQPGNAGTGGTGGNGGAGGNGGNGANGVNNDGDGGNGARGGDGGDGGRGRDGSNGISSASLAIGGAFINNSGSSVPNPVTVTVDYFNKTGCTNSIINIEKGSGVWGANTTDDFVNDLGSTLSSYDQNSTTAAISFGNAGFYMVEAGGGEYARFVKIIETRDLPVIIPIAGGCAGLQIDLASTTVADDYLWEVAYEASPQSPFQTFNVQNPGTVVLPDTGQYIVKLSVLDNCCGWSVPVFESFTAVNLPTVTFQPVNDFCENDASFDLTSSGMPLGGTFSGSGVSQGNTFTPSLAGPGAHNIRYEYVHSGCTIVDSQTITVNGLPAVSFTGLAGPYCLNDSTPVQLTGNPAGGTFSGTGTSGATFIPAQAAVGTNIITYTFQDNNTGCAADTSSAVVVTGLPSVNFDGLDNFYCEDNTSTIPLSGQPAGGNFSGTGISGTDFSPATAAAGIHEITYTYTDVNQCTNSRVKSVVIYELPSVTIVNLDTQYCQNDDLIPLEGFPTGGSFTVNSTSATTYDPGQFTIGSSNDVIYTFTDNRGCVASVQLSTTVLPYPTADFGNIANTYCKNTSPVLLSGTPTDGIFSGEGITGVDNTFHPSIASVGVHTLSYTVTDNNGCSFTDTKTTEVFDIPSIAQIDVTDARCTSSDGIIEVTPDQSGLSVQWAHDNSITSTTLTDIPEGLYEITLTDGNNCSFAQEIEVQCYVTSAGLDVYIPNAFSPNGDGQNDVFYLESSKVTEAELNIFDRWGQRVFHAKNLSEGWDGTVNGKIPEQGVYVYVANLVYDNGESEQLTGSITLLK